MLTTVSFLLVRRHGFRLLLLLLVLQQGRHPSDDIARILALGRVRVHEVGDQEGVERVIGKGAFGPPTGEVCVAVLVALLELSIRHTDGSVAHLEVRWRLLLQGIIMISTIHSSLPAASAGA